MARTCVWCDAPLPEPKGKGHRRRDFCNNICKQKHYVWHKQMRHDVAKLEEPFWHNAYRVLVEQYKGLEHRLQITMDHLSKAIIDVEKLQESRKYHMDKLEKMRNDYHARMKAAGMSKQDINEFDDYWKDLFKYDPYGLDLD